MKIFLLMSVLFLHGCASYHPTGGFYTNGKMAIYASNIKSEKTAKACMSSVLGLWATGDASIEAATKNGDITKIASIDYSVNNILGIYGEYCVIVKGK